MPHILGRLKSTCNFLDKEGVKVPAVRDRKIATITASAKPAVEKLLTVSIKVALVEDGQDVSMKKIWIYNPG